MDEVIKLLSLFSSSESHTLFIKRSVRFHTFLTLDEVKIHVYLSGLSPSLQDELEVPAAKASCRYFFKTILSLGTSSYKIFNLVFNMAAVMSLRYRASVNRDLVPSLLRSRSGRSHATLSFPNRGRCVIPAGAARLAAKPRVLWLFGGILFLQNFCGKIMQVVTELNGAANQKI